MDKYLKQLLELHAKVILPSFGAIVVENEESGNLMFNEYLSYNDGKLDDLIVSESNMELQEAQNMIAKYIRDIQVQIDKGESYDIFELGRFFKNQDGDIEFEGNLKMARNLRRRRTLLKLQLLRRLKKRKKKSQNKNLRKRRKKSRRKKLNPRKLKKKLNQNQKRKSLRKNKKLIRKKRKRLKRTLNLKKSLQKRKINM